ncbi:uncharacterized protein VP01_6475g1 [Puccinia sorghi]|uniref:Uncharacterized protein n=1 Tax=Puccinia sorghi TaxID=27349 RepID=A0A0L6UFP0_9BASI|nr:uncharacterized protein VP01_6475g1 [Puccinia sorghi]
MEALNSLLDKFMHMMGKENAQKLATEETPNKLRPALTPRLANKTLLLLLLLPLTPCKVVFAISFMGDYAATWSQPYLNKVFNGEPVVFDEFLINFRYSFFDHHHRHHALAL